MPKKLTFEFLQIVDAAAVKVAVMSRKGILFFLQIFADDAKLPACGIIFLLDTHRRYYAFTHVHLCIML